MSSDVVNALLVAASVVADVQRKPSHAITRKSARSSASDDVDQHRINQDAGDANDAAIKSLNATARNNVIAAKRVSLQHNKDADDVAVNSITDKSHESDFVSQEHALSQSMKPTSKASAVYSTLNGVKHRAYTVTPGSQSAPVSPSIRAERKRNEDPINTLSDSNHQQVDLSELSEKQLLDKVEHTTITTTATTTLSNDINTATQGDEDGAASIELIINNKQQQHIDPNTIPDWYPSNDTVQIIHGGDNHIEGMQPMAALAAEQVDRDGTKYELNYPHQYDFPYGGPSMYPFYPLYHHHHHYANPSNVNHDGNALTATDDHFTGMVAPEPYYSVNPYAPTGFGVVNDLQDMPTQDNQGIPIYTYPEAQAINFNPLLPRSRRRGAHIYGAPIRSSRKSYLCKGNINLLYKTRQCVYYSRDLPCPNGDGCSFAHGRHEIRSFPAITATPLTITSDNRGEDFTTSKLTANDPQYWYNTHHPAYIPSSTNESVEGGQRYTHRAAPRHRAFSDVGRIIGNGESRVRLSSLPELEDPSQLQQQQCLPTGSQFTRQDSHTRSNPSTKSMDNRSVPIRWTRPGMNTTKRSTQQTERSGKDRTTYYGENNEIDDGNVEVGDSNSGGVTDVETGGALPLLPTQNHHRSKRTSALRRNPRYKTTLCRAYVQGTPCAYDTMCDFAHGTHELCAPKYPRHLTFFQRKSNRRDLEV